jgi:hypothetical protein
MIHLSTHLFSHWTIPLRGQSQDRIKYILIKGRWFLPVFRIRMGLGLPDPDPLIRGTGTDPDPYIIKQKYKEKPLFLLYGDFFMTFILSLKNDVNVPSRK